LVFFIVIKNKKIMCGGRGIWVCRRICWQTIPTIISITPQFSTTFYNFHTFIGIMEDIVRFQLTLPCGTCGTLWNVWHVPHCPVHCMAHGTLAATRSDNRLSGMLARLVLASSVMRCIAFVAYNLAMVCDREREDIGEKRNRSLMIR